MTWEEIEKCSAELSQALEAGASEMANWTVRWGEKLLDELVGSLENP